MYVCMYVMENDSACLSFFLLVWRALILIEINLFGGAILEKEKKKKKHNKFLLGRFWAEITVPEGGREW